MKRIIFYALIALILGFSGLNVPACDWPPLEKIEDQKQFEAAVAREFKTAVAVFSGEVRELSQTTVKFKVGKVWKGDLKDEFVMSTGTRLADGIATSSSCDYTFKFHEKYLVFAFKTEYGDVQTWLPSLTQVFEDAGRTTGVLGNKFDVAEKNEK